MTVVGQPVEFNRILAVTCRRGELCVRPPFDRPSVDEWREQLFKSTKPYRRRRRSVRLYLNAKRWCNYFQVDLCEIKTYFVYARVTVNPQRKSASVVLESVTSVKWTSSSMNPQPIIFCCIIGSHYHAYCYKNVLFDGVDGKIFSVKPVWISLPRARPSRTGCTLYAM